MRAQRHGHGIGKTGHADQQSGHEAPVVGLQDQPGHDQGQGEHERVLAVGQIDREDAGERRGRHEAGHVVDTPHVGVEQHRQHGGRSHHENAVVDELGQPVEDEAVADHLVGAAVPLVIPEQRTALTQLGDLVEVSRSVPAGDAGQPHDQRRGGDHSDRTQDEPENAAAGGRVRGHPPPRLYDSRFMHVAPRSSPCPS